MQGPTNAAQDMWNIVRALTPGVMDKAECSEISARYRNRYIVKVFLYIPEALYRYTLLYLTCVAYRAAQVFGYENGMHELAYHAKQCAVSLAQGSFNSTVYQLGWAFPRTAIIVNSLSRLWIKTFQLQNFMAYTLGYSCVLKGELPIDAGAAVTAIACRLKRIGSLALFLLATSRFTRAVANAALPAVQKRKLDRAIDNFAGYVTSKLELPAYELWITGPGYTQTGMILTALLIDRISRLPVLRNICYSAFGL